MSTSQDKVDPATHAVDAKPAANEDPIQQVIPIGYVPYAPSLPEVMGPQNEFPLEWWYYAGWATDISGSEVFSILLLITRAKDSGGFAYGIGQKNDQSSKVSHFSTACSDQLHISATANPWSIAVSEDKPGQLESSAKLTSDTPLGLAGATYKLHMKDEQKNVEVTLQLQSTVGLVQEWPMEFAMPAMTIQKGSTIKIGREEKKLGEGNIWLDRQIITNTSGIKKNRGVLYLGTWVAITMKSQTCYSLTFFWEKNKVKKQQWITGTDVKKPPRQKAAFEYPSLNPGKKYKQPQQGVSVLKEEDFDLNILNPSNPLESPHKKPTADGNTYCTAWHLNLTGQVYKMVAVVPNAEVYDGSYFYEGAAILYDKEEKIVGHAFVEQMGFN